MSRFEGEFQSNGEAPLEFGELAHFLGQGDANRRRQEAIACYLSGGEGWDDAVRQLGGAFAGERKGTSAKAAGEKQTGLRRAQEG